MKRLLSDIRHFWFDKATSPYDEAADRRGATYLGYLLNRKVWVTPWDVFRLNALGYRKRIARAIAYACTLAAVCVLIALASTWAYLALSGETGRQSSVRASFSTVTGVAYPIDIDYQGVHANMGAAGAVLIDGGSQAGGNQKEDDTAVDSASGTVGHFDSMIYLICLAEVGLTSLLGMAFSGAFAQIFLTPVDCIKVAPLALVRRMHDGTWALSTRIWVCLPQETFLYDFSVSMNYTFSGRYADSSLDLTEGETEWLIGSKVYSMVRGVWCVDIPLSSEGGRKLINQLESKNQNPSVQILLRGTTSSGEVIAKNVTFDRASIVFGYRFASYERDAFCAVSECDPTQANPEVRYYSYGAFAQIEQDRQANPAEDQDARRWNDWLDVNGLTPQQAAKRKELISSHLAEPQCVWEPHLTRNELRELRQL